MGYQIYIEIETNSDIERSRIINDMVCDYIIYEGLDRENEILKFKLYPSNFINVKKAMAYIHRMLEKALDRQDYSISHSY